MEISKKYKETIMYLIFGALTVAVNIVTYIVLTRLVNMKFMTSNAIAWMAAVFFAYVTNKLFVFESKELEAKFLLKEFIYFISCRLLSGIMEMIFMYIMISLIGIDDFIVKGFTNILVIMLNYILSKLIIFNKKQVS